MNPFITVFFLAAIFSSHITSASTKDFTCEVFQEKHGQSLRTSFKATFPAFASGPVLKTSYWGPRTNGGKFVVYKDKTIGVYRIKGDKAKFTEIGRFKYSDSFKYDDGEYKINCPKIFAYHARQFANSLYYKTLYILNDITSIVSLAYLILFFWFVRALFNKKKIKIQNKKTYNTVFAFLGVYLFIFSMAMGNMRHIGSPQVFIYFVLISLVYLGMVHVIARKSKNPVLISAIMGLLGPAVLYMSFFLVSFFRKFIS